uniref:POU domain protein n=1 Tax=Geotrypetes seraphini TaxID=260995 RepID=A0A6P8QGA0_GEOSA|nr:POU domain, class 6, transcription factor 1 isoform X3 [Geotrypetes seraphini]
MDPGALPQQDPSLTVNEQVIVMSGHETIRVLEVGVDAPAQTEEAGKSFEASTLDTPGSQSYPAEACDPGREAAQSVPEIACEEPMVISWNCLNICPNHLQPCRKPTAEQLHFFSPAGYSTAPMLSTALQTSAPAAPTLPAQPVFQAPQVMQPQTPLQTQPVPMIAPTLKAAETQAQITVQPTSFSFNPAIISAASLGGQTQLLSSLAATPVITSAIPGVQSIANQILTNAQGQVIGTLPWLLNSAGITASSMPVALSAQNLQVQTVTPQLLLNAQGQVIATLASTAMQPAVVQKQSDPQSPEKLDEQMPPIEPAPAISQPAVVLASPTPVPASPPSPVPLPCSETPTVGQLVSKSQATAIDEDGINLEEIREFAKNFKIRRLSLGLTQTQVGQALTATEGPAYSQSAICRFEKLDITPKSAQKLKPVLEKWLLEAEMRNQEGQQNLMDFVGGEPSKKRKRRTSFTPQAIEALNAYFEKNALPTGQEITEIAKELNYDREVVRVWFCNRRQTLKNTSKLNVFQIP